MLHFFGSSSLVRSRNVTSLSSITIMTGIIVNEDVISIIIIRTIIIIIDISIMVIIIIIVIIKLITYNATELMKYVPSRGDVNNRDIRGNVSGT